MKDLHETAKALFKAAVDRADPATALATAFQKTPPGPPLGSGRLIILALGKAAVPMVRKAMELLPTADRVVAVTNPENLIPIAGATVMAGAHPVPDASSIAAGEYLRDAVADLTAKDRVVALISGGGSALAVLPAGALTLADKSAVAKQLLASGMDINKMNLIRQQLSDLKGGGLLQLAAPAQVTSYILSDVIGDDLRAIASGPTVAPLGTQEDAIALLQEAGLWDDLPASVVAHLQASPKKSDVPPSAAHLIGSNRHSLEAMLDTAQAQGWNARIVNDALEGDVADAAAEIIAAAKSIENTTSPAALIFGGETTVQLRGDGLGGRNQELALRVARDGASELTGKWLFLSGGTDGRDGPTEAAGGIVDGTSWDKIRTAGADPQALLANNDSNKALALCDALLMTGGTGTNVADVQVLLRLPT